MLLPNKHKHKLKHIESLSDLYLRLIKHVKNKIKKYIELTHKKGLNSQLKRK